MSRCICQYGPNLVYDRSNGIWIMKDDGTMKTQLQANGAHPRWAPGTKDLIAFLQFKNGYWAVCTMDNKGNNVHVLTGYTCGEEISWSPDRKWIAYESFQNNNWDIYKIKADGSSQTRLTTNAASDRFPAWSPDGKKIAYWSDQGKMSDIFTMNTDGSGKTNMTTVSAGHAALNPVWSPSGAKIAFVCNPSLYVSPGYERLYTVDVKTAPNANEISSVDGVNSYVYAPSGDYILYAANQPDGGKIYKQTTADAKQTPEVLTTYYMTAGRIDANEIALYFYQQKKSTPASTDGLFVLTWRWQNSGKYQEALLDHYGSEPDI